MDEGDAGPLEPIMDNQHDKFFIVQREGQAQGQEARPFNPFIDEKDVPMRRQDEANAKFPGMVWPEGEREYVYTTGNKAGMSARDKMLLRVNTE